MSAVSGDFAKSTLEERIMNSSKTPKTPARAKAKAPSSNVATAKALIEKGNALSKQGTLSKQGVYKEAFALYDEVVQRFGKDASPAMHIQVARALDSKAYDLRKLNRHGEAITAFDEIIRRLDKDDSPGARKLLLATFALKLLSLEEQTDMLKGKDRYEKVVAFCDDLVKRHTGNKHYSSALGHLVAIALRDKVGYLRKQDKTKEALATYDEIVRLFGNKRSIGSRQVVSQALVGKCEILYEQKKPAEAIALCDDIIRRFGRNKDLVVIDHVASAKKLKEELLRAKKKKPA